MFYVLFIEDRMMRMDFINTFVGIPLGYIMWMCFMLLKNYGVAIIVFTLLTKVIMFPLSIWVQKNSIKMIRIQPEYNRIQARNVGNKDKVIEEQSALFKRERYSPLAGMIPMLVQIPIILGLIAVVYNPLQHLLHLDANLIPAFIEQAKIILNNPDLGSSAQIAVVNLIKDPMHVAAFSSIHIPGVDVGSAIATIQNMDFMFLGMDLSHTPSLFAIDMYSIIPLLSGISAFFLSFFQNKENVLQKEQGFLGRWGMTVFLVAFSTYFAFIVPAGIGLYWIFGNLFAIALIYILNYLYDPKKQIDYDELEKSKLELAESKKLERALKLTPEEKSKGKADYKRFFKDDLTVKDIVIYSEKSGFFKYFNDLIDGIIENSDYVIHYITSDPRDGILEKSNDRLQTYFIDDTHLIPLFMKIDSYVMVMTTPNLQTYHLKRSILNKNVEYIYIPHDPMSTHMGANIGAFDNFDTILCVGQPQIDEIRETERVYNLKEKNLIPCGYGLIDQLMAQYESIEKSENDIKKVLIAPSWQEGNIMDSCVDQLLDQLLDQGYDITLRPHPEYVKRYAMKMQSIISRYKEKFNEHFRIETDFSSNVTIFTADIVITDWSGISLEFAYSTKKPALFINTPKKIMNPEYEKISCVPVEVTLRDKLGISLDLDKLDETGEKVSMLLGQREDYKDRISQVVREYLFNPGCSKGAVTDYVIEAIRSKKDKK